MTKAPELVYYTFASAQILAYRYTVSYDDPIAHKGQWIYYIDANTGKKINAYNMIHEALAPATISGALLNGEGGGVKLLTGGLDAIDSMYYLSNTSSSGTAYTVYNTDV